MNLELLARYLPDWEEVQGRSFRWRVPPRRVRPDQEPPLPSYGEMTVQPGDLVAWNIRPGADASYYSRLGRAARGLVFDAHWLLDDTAPEDAEHYYYPAAVIAWNDNICTCSDHSTLRLVSRPVERGIIKSVEQKTKSSRPQRVGQGE
jgi:hypothetical protein